MTKYLSGLFPLQFNGNSNEPHFRYTITIRRQRDFAGNELDCFLNLKEFKAVHLSEPICTLLIHCKSWLSSLDIGYVVCGQLSPEALLKTFNAPCLKTLRHLNIHFEQEEGDRYFHNGVPGEQLDSLVNITHIKLSPLYHVFHNFLIHGKFSLVLIDKPPGDLQLVRPPAPGHRYPISGFEP